MWLASLSRVPWYFFARNGGQIFCDLRRYKVQSLFFMGSLCIVSVPTFRLLICG